MSRSFALGEHFEEFIDAQLKAGRYADADEVVRDGLRLLEEEEVLRQYDPAEVRGLVAEARKDERLIPAEAVFDRLEAKYRAMAEKSGR